MKLVPGAADALSRGGHRNPALPMLLRDLMAGQHVSGSRPLFPELRPDRGGHGAVGRAAAVRARFPHRARRAPSRARIPDLENIFVLDVPPSIDPLVAAKALKRDPSVVYAEPDRIVSLSATPNDTYFSSIGSWGQPYPDMWGLYRINAQAAWDVTTGSDSVVVAVVDTGLDYNHPDIAGRVWTNADEIPNNGIDDDHNGFVDDVRGWDFFWGDNDVSDQSGHGTHVAGTIAAATNNGQGVAGVTWATRIMPLKALSSCWSTEQNLADALNYAANNGADIVNCSWGGPGPYPLIKDAVDYCCACGCIVVASAGNERADVASCAPAGLPNVVCVANTDPYDVKEYHSNYGRTVDVCAPGVDILSLRAAGTGLPELSVGTNYIRYNGTSMSCPHVVGGLALLLAAHPTWPMADIIGQLVGTTDDIYYMNHGWEGMLGTGRINLAQALNGSPTAIRITVLQQTIGDSAASGYASVYPGQRAQLAATLKQSAGPSTDATLTTSDPYISMMTGSISLGSVSGWRVMDNSTNPFVFDVSAHCPTPHSATFNLHLSSGAYSTDSPLVVSVCGQQFSEVWRGIFTGAYNLSVNATDGSCWVADLDSNQVVHLAADGRELWRGNFSHPVHVSVNSSDGSCWVADTGNGTVVHLAENGTRLWAGEGFSQPESVSVNPSDGSCWVADYVKNQVVHLAANGTQLWQGGGFLYPYSVSANQSDGSCWVADMGHNQVVHLSAGGGQLWRGGGFNYPCSVSANSTDGSCWVVDSGNDAVVHLAQDGTQLWRGGGFYPCCVSVSPTDGSCWVADSGHDCIVHLSQNGVQLSQTGPFYRPYSDSYNPPYCVAVNPSDGSCWVTLYKQVIHIGQDGTLVRGGGGFSTPWSVSANPTDGSVWVADTYNNQVVNIAEDGTELWRSGASATFNGPLSISVDAADGSCWVADTGNNQVVHLAHDGTQLWRSAGSPTFCSPESVSVNPTDGSCWVADTGNNQIVHLAQNGTELWRGAGDPAFNHPQSVSVNPSDGSCWVASAGSYEVVHLAQDGTQLWRGGGFSASAVSVNPTDGSCWAAAVASGEVVHLSATGSLLWKGGGFNQPQSVSVNLSDGSCWVADTGNNQVAHVDQSGTAVWRNPIPKHGSVEFNYPLSVSANPTDGTCWVADSGNDQIVHLATHTLTVTPSASPTTIPSGGTSSLNATYSDNLGYPIATWQWSDEGARGTFSPSAAVQNPTYTAPTNITGTSYTITLAATVTSRSTPTFTATGFTTLTMMPGPHALSVTAHCDPSTVAPGGTTACTATAIDTSGHGIAMWSWSDGGAGGAFSPTATVQTPTYVAPGGGGATNLTVTLTASATCNGPAPLLASGSTSLTVARAVVAEAGPCKSIASGGSTTLQGSASGGLVPYTYAWSPTTGLSNPNIAQPTASPTTTTTYTLTVRDSGDGISTDSVTVTVIAGNEAAEAWRGGGLNNPQCVSVNPADGSCWVAAGQVVHLAQDGTRLWSSGGSILGAQDVSVNAADGSCWTDDESQSEMVHVSPSGTQLWRGGGFNASRSAANPNDGSCWVADCGHNQVVHLDRTGTELWRGGGFLWPVAVSVNPNDGSCWVADMGHNQVVHLSAGGVQLWRGAGFSSPASVSVDPSDGSCWVADELNNQMVLLSASGTQLWRGGGFSKPWSVSVNSSDSSCWVADTGNNQVVHLARNGTELWRGGGFNGPQSVSVNSNDGSCWVADTGNNQVVHLVIVGRVVAEAGPDRAIASGGFTTLEGSASQGQPPYTCSWLPTTGLSNPNIAQPTASPTATMTYTLTVRDAVGQTGTDTVTVTVSSPVAAEAGPNRTIAAGGSTTLAGSASGGLAPYTYSWSPTTGLNNPNIAQPTASPTTTTTYTLTVHDSLSQVATDTVTVTVASAVAAEAGPNQIIASGGCCTLQGSASGGLAPYTYAWSPTTGLNNPNISQPTASPTTTTTYTLTVHDSLSQVATDTVTVTVTAPGTDNAVVVSSTMPASVLRNRASGVSITIQNTGTTTWTQAGGYALSSVNPDDNMTWGLNRVELSPSDSIAPGQSKTFTFNITAPNSATYLSGPLHCDWQMICGGTRFGASSSSTVNVYSFADVTPDLSYWRYVEAAYTAGLTAGCGSDYRGPLYCPLSNCTRAMMAVFLVRAKGMTPLMSPTAHFADVGSGLSYYGHVERLADPSSWYDAGNPCLTCPTAGCAPTPPRFCPNDNCTRAMMAVFLCRACGKCPYTTIERPTPTFADVGTSLSYYGFVERLADPASWNNDPPTAGCAPSPRRYCPLDIATRAQMAVFLARAFHLPYQ